MQGRRDFAVWAYATIIILACFGVVIGVRVIEPIASSTSPLEAEDIVKLALFLGPIAVVILCMLAKWLYFGYRIWRTTLPRQPFP